MIKVGLIGGGGIVTAHLRGYRAHADRIAVTCVSDIVPEVAQARAAELGVPGYTDFRAMLAQQELDAVDICLPHHLHAEAIAAAAAAGRHVLCEKPLCLTAEEARSVQQAVRAAGITVMCAHNQLFLPAVAKAKELLDSGAIGTLYEVRATDCFYNDFDPATMGWRATSRTSGGGELIDTGYHPTYLLLHLAGAPPLEATALLSRHRLSFAEGEDSAQVLVRFANGVVGHLVTSWAYDPPPTTERFLAVGDQGSLTSDGTELSVYHRSGATEHYRFPPVDTFVAEIGHFADALISGTPPLHTEKEGIEALGMILAAYVGARTGTFAPVIRAS